MTWRFVYQNPTYFSLKANSLLIDEITGVWKRVRGVPKRVTVFIYALSMLKGSSCLTYAIPPEISERYVSVPASQEVQVLSVQNGGMFASGRRYLVVRHVGGTDHRCPKSRLHISCFSTVPPKTESSLLGDQRGSPIIKPWWWSWQGAHR